MTEFISTAECDSCEPWVRWYRNRATGLHVRQERHEDRCPRWPLLNRDDTAAMTGD